MLVHVKKNVKNELKTWGDIYLSKSLGTLEENITTKTATATRESGSRMRRGGRDGGNGR